jgi:hypothetical protein
MMRFLTQVALLLGAALTVSTNCEDASALGDAIGGGEPVWVADLRHLGLGSEGARALGTIDASRQLAFGSNDELVVIGDSGGPSPEQTVRGFALESRSGTMFRTAEWRRKHWSCVLGTSSGAYAVTTETGLSLYSSGLKEVVTTSAYSARLASPDGRYLLASEGDSTLLLDASSLQATGVQFRRHSVDSFVGDRIAYTGYVNRSREASVLFDDVDEKLPAYQTDCQEVRPHFLSSDVLAVLGCGRFEVIRIGGERLFSGSTHGVFAAVSRDGTRFAIVEAVFGLGSHAKLSSEDIRVFDAKLGREVFATRVQELRGLEDANSGVTLSPDGSRLAVNSLGIVRLYDLPVGSP